MTDRWVTKSTLVRFLVFFVAGGGFSAQRGLKQDRDSDNLFSSSRMMASRICWRQEHQSTHPRIPVSSRLLT